MINTAGSGERTVLDFARNEIRKGSLVKILKGTIYEGCEGIVIAPDAMCEGLSCAVAVFFPALPSSVRAKRDGLLEWDQKWSEQLNTFRIGDDCLRMFSGADLLNCPRTFFLEPENLLNIDEWSPETLSAHQDQINERARSKDLMAPRGVYG